MRSTRQPRGNALLLSIIVVLVMTIAAVGVIRYASREVAGAHAARRQAALAGCAEAGRALLMSQVKVLGKQPVDVEALNKQLEAATPTVVKGGHYGDEVDALGATTVSTLQLMELNPLTVAPSLSASDLTNRIGMQVHPYRAIVHCTQGNSPDAREYEVEFAVSYGM